jgi:adenosylmethionine-8-amino-7-oxononanoate aminotransferase
MTSFWRGFTSMGATRDRELRVARGQGCRIWDSNGKEYLDGTASLWYCNVGHGRAEIADRVAAQMREIAGFHTFGVLSSGPAEELAARVAAIAPMPDAAVFFTPGGGSDSVDTAGKLARRYWSALGQPDKQIFVSRQHGYHGMNAYGTSLAGIPANVAGYGELVGQIEHVPWDSVEAVAQLFENSASHIAAFIGEPVIGAGGVIPPPDGYWPAIRKLCLDHDVLFVSDEVICGFGRLGTWFGCERYGVEPDMITCAKGLTSGYIPLGAVIASRRVQAPFWDEPSAPPFRHGYTYGGHPAACVAGLANLDILQRERLVERVVELEPVLDAAVRESFADSPLAYAVRSAGLLAAVELPPAVLAAEPRLPDLIEAHARELGLITRGLRGCSLQLSPSFVSEPDDLREMTRRLRSAFDAAIEHGDVPASALSTAAG